MKERTWGLAFLLLGGLWIYDGWRLTLAERTKNSTFDSLGPDRYMMLIGILLALVGVLMALARPAQATAGNAPADGAESAPFPALPMLFTVVLVLYALVLPVAGFTLSTFAFFLAAYYLGGMRRPLVIVAASAVSAIVSYALFFYLADMPLPGGFVGF